MDHEKSSFVKAFGKSRFEAFKVFLRRSFLAWAVFFLGAAALTFILVFKIETLPNQVVVGSFATRDIKADQSYEIVDKALTLEMTEDAVGSVKPVYEYDQEVGRELDHRMKEAFEKTRAQMYGLAERTDLERREFFEKQVGFSFAEEEMFVLLTFRFRPDFELLLRQLVGEAMKYYVVDDAKLVRDYGHIGIFIRTKSLAYATTDNPQEIFLSQLDGIRDLKQIQTILTGLVDRLLKQRQSVRDLPADMIARIATRFIRPNLIFDEKETELRRKKAAQSVKPVVIKIQAGESIIRSGELYQPWHKLVIEGMQTQKRKTNFFLKAVGTFLLVSALTLLTHLLASRFIRKFKLTSSDRLFLGSYTIFILMLVRVFAAIAPPLKDAIGLDVNIQSFYYAIPISMGVMLVRLTLKSEVAIFYGGMVSLFAGIFFDLDPGLILYFLLSSMITAGSMSYMSRRSSILKSGLLTGVGNAMIIIAMKLIQMVSVAESNAWANFLLPMAFGFLSGIYSAILVLFLTPVVEMLFGYTTDMKLLELGNLNHPLLKEMIVKAPGTYHHSQLVAVLCEAAAQAIHANSILARVGAYFHDVGKMVKPLYFVENQMGQDNRHDKLSPSMSALIIASHVKEGIELAEKYKLPQPIIDMIPQHQGTKLIAYFYNKAKAQQGEDGSPINEEDYRYPGPKPQSREAGILLLADGVEAAVRSMPEKSAQKIEAMVQKMINKSFAEEQLEECDLTLSDLKKIAFSFVKVLIGIYHHRIPYPEQQERSHLLTLPVR